MIGIVCGDAHFCDKLPEKRKDDFYNAQFRKLAKLKNLIAIYKPDGLFLLGDVFDRHTTDTWFVNEIIRRLNDLGCKIYAIVGNHCVHGRVDSVDDVSLGTLFSSGVITRINGDFVLHDIPMRALDYTTKHTVDMYKTGEPRLMFTHNMIVPRKVIFEHILAKDVSAVCPGSTIFAGHYHPPFDYINKVALDGQKLGSIINPGVMVRTEVGEKSIDPSVILFEVDHPSNVSYKKLSLGGDPGDEVFDLDRHEKEKKRGIDLEQFIDDVRAAKFQSQDIEAMIRELGKTQKVKENIIEEAINRITTAKATVE